MGIDRNYFKIPTIDGNFYLINEYETMEIRGENSVTYNDYFVEFFTKLACNVKSDIFDIKEKDGKLKLETVKDELFERDKNIKDKLEYNNIVHYNTIEFLKTHLWNYHPSFKNIYYQDKLPFNAKYIIDTKTNGEFSFPEYNLHKITDFEFAKNVENIINKYGSYENAKLEMLRRIEKQALICKARNEYIDSIKKIENEESKKANEYLKKFF